MRRKPPSVTDFTEPREPGWYAAVDLGAGIRTALGRTTPLRVGKDMSLVGKLDEVELPELLEAIAKTRKTGKLRLTRRDREGIIVFRQGMIVYAASSSARQTLGNLLLCERLIDETQLTSALELQHLAQEEQRLGNILLEMDAVDEETLERTVHQQTEKVILEFMSWKSGFFKFDPLELSDYGEIEVDAADFLIREGLKTDRVLSDLAARLEEADLEEVDETKSTGPAAGPTSRDLTSLKSIMGEIRSPEFTGEITQKILTFAQDLFGRGIFFVVRLDGLGVMGQFGMDSSDDKAEARLRELMIPLDQPSILSEAAERKEAVLEILSDTEWNQKILEVLGGPTESESLAVPLTVNDQVLLVLYGDQLAESAGSGWLEELELLMLQAGLAMEKTLLAKRIEHYEALRRDN